MTKARKVEQQEAIAKLRELCPPGTKIWCILRHVSRSGMRRKIDLYTFTCDEHGQPDWLFLTGYAATAMGYRWDRGSGGIITDGCGMDMGFHLVNSLSYTLHGHVPQGAALQAHAKGRPFKPTRDSYRPGYSLTHEWL